MTIEQDVSIFLNYIYSGISMESDLFSKFLNVEDRPIISLMNNRFFSKDQKNLIHFISNSLSLEEGKKSQESVRKELYKFIARYIEAYKEYVKEYLKGLFAECFQFFKAETEYTCKIESLGVIKQILLEYSDTELSDVLDPIAFNNSLIMKLKTESEKTLSNTVRGEVWTTVGILQDKFKAYINSKSKEEAQTVSLIELKKHVSDNKNFSTIAAILRGFVYSLNESHLPANRLEELFDYAKTIMIPVTEKYTTSIAALELISAQCTLFQPFLIKKASLVFDNFIGLMGKENKDFKWQLQETFVKVIEILVNGIKENQQDGEMIKLFNKIGIKVWEMLESQMKYDLRDSEENKRFRGSVITIVKILGILSPLILSINGMQDLRRFFSKLLSMCNKKMLKAFGDGDDQIMSFDKNKKMKLILYNQKELISFILSFAQIFENLDEIDEKEALQLEEMFVTGVKQYHRYLKKYIRDLHEALVKFLIGLSTKANIFTPWCKKTILASFMESLDYQRFEISSDEEYYEMVLKASQLWTAILTHQEWSHAVLKEFSKIVFDCLEHLFLNLDISYKSNLELEIEDENKGVEKEEEEEVFNVFFKADENIEMSNVSEYQYVSSLALVFNEILSKIDKSLYFDRVYEFYEKIIHRIKIFPKSIPLMKVIRSLNMFIAKIGWLNNAEDGDQKNIDQLLCVLKNFFLFVCDNIFKYQENYFYEALKMLLSMPSKVFLAEECEIMKNSLSGIIIKSLELGHEIISLSFEAVETLSNLFSSAKYESNQYLSGCIPFLEKYINFSKNTDKTIECEEKEEVQSYLFLYERKITRVLISANVMKFLGSIGGLAHMMIENSTQDYISWDYYCKIEIGIVLGNDTILINLTKILSRTCWLMLHGSENEKIVSCEFMHGILVYVIGRAATKTQAYNLETKENLSNFFDRVLPTLLSIGSNQSHPSQQLIHTLIIQTIHFLANTQDSTSPDIQTLLKHLISLYTGAEDMSMLASKCLSELVKWHIKQAPALEDYSYPMIKTVMRNVWSLVGNKKARNGLLQFLIKLLKLFHRNTKLMEVYAIELCSLIISLGRTDKEIEYALKYLIEKYILAIKPYIKHLIIEQKNRRFRKISTLQSLIAWIYNNSFFSVYRQQRTIAFILWEEILGRYGDSFNTNMLPGNFENNVKVFLFEQRNAELKYLFGSSRPIIIDEEDPKLTKKLPKITAYGEVWIKLIQRNVFEKEKMIKNFKDLEEVYLESFCSFVEYLTQSFINLAPDARILNFETQKSMIDCILTFIEFYLNLGEQSQSIQRFLVSKVPIFEKRLNRRNITFVEVLLKLLFKPNGLIPNFNYDLIYSCVENSNLNQEMSESEKKELIETYYFNQICKFLRSLLANNLYECIKKFIQTEYGEEIQTLIPEIMRKQKYYDREIRCVMSSLSTFAKLEENEHKLFDETLRETLKITVEEFEDGLKDIKEGEISAEKKSLLIWYILQHADKYRVIRDFLVTAIKKDSNVFKKNEKSMLKSINSNWYGVNRSLIELMSKSQSFLKLIIPFTKILSPEKKFNLYKLIIENLLHVGLNPKSMALQTPQQEKERIAALGEMLKICYYICEESSKFFFENPKFQDYLFELVYVSLETKHTYEIHSQGMSLAGIIFSLNREKLKDEKYDFFQQKARSALSALTSFYIPFQCFKAQTSDIRNKSVNYLKIFKEMICLSKDIKLLELVFIVFKDQDLEGYYAEQIESLVHECLEWCYKVNSNELQKEDLKWMLNIYLGENEDIIDVDCWRNVRVIIVDEIMKRAIPMTNQEVLIDFFQNETNQIFNQFLKAPLPTGVQAKEIIKQLDLKRAGYVIIEELYSNLPRKATGTEEIHKNGLHKELIKNCNSIVKVKFNEQIEKTLKEYDEEVIKEKNKALVITKTEKNELKRSTCIEYLRNFLCSVYNCLIVIFISTQEKKEQFKIFLFESKEFTFWRNLVDPDKFDYNFEVETSFPEKKPIIHINKKLEKRIKEKYWSSSLYAIEEEFVPGTFVENANPTFNPVQSEVANPELPPPSAELEMDHINKHPCMVNLVRLVDFLDWKFKEEGTPGWMGPIFNLLNKEDCPLSIRILLIKLILNRPRIFIQNIWPEVMLKYLTLKENGGKSIHYFFRDVATEFINFTNKGYRPDTFTEVNKILDKIIKCTLHDNVNVFTSNVELMKDFMKIEGVQANESTILSMLKEEEKPKKEGESVREKYNWRMCAVIAITCCMANKVPILKAGESFNERTDKFIKYKFFFTFRSENRINFISQMARELIKKYRIAAGTFLGELLKFVIENKAEILEQDELIKTVSNFLAEMNEQNNRVSKEKFSITLLHTVTRYPAILNSPKLYQETESAVSIYTKEERNQILQCLILYSQYLNENHLIFHLPQVMVNIRSIIGKIVNDIMEVQTSLILLLAESCTHENLQNTEIRETYLYIYDELERVYGNNQDESLAIIFYRIVIKLKDFTNDKDLIMTRPIEELKRKVTKNLLKGLGSRSESVRELIFSEFERELKEYEDTAERMLDILEKLYDPDYEELWLINVVPLVLSSVKKSSDYTRLRFEESLGDLASFYDWDFRRNYKTNNSSQPYTPAFTLATGALNVIKRSDGTIMNSIMPSLSDQKGMLRSSILQYGSQDEQVFTVLASQSDFGGSFASQGSGWGASYDQGSEINENNGQIEGKNKLNHIFMKTQRRRNKGMEDFKLSNIRKLPSAVKMVGNKLRFNKNLDKNAEDHSYQNKHTSKPPKNNAGALIRKYRIGELPDIQITTQDIVDPMLYLASRDNEFASELFLLTFIKLAFYARQEKKQKFKTVICELLGSSKKFDYNFISTLEKSLINLCHNLKERVDFSMKEIAFKSNTIDYAVVFTEENQIQTITNNLHHREQLWRKNVDDNWGDLVDLYQQLNEEDLIYGVLIKLAVGDEKELLIQALNYKKLGNMKKSEDCFNEAFIESSNKRIKEFIEKEKIDCKTILGTWEPVSNDMWNITKNGESLSVNDQKIFCVSLQNNKLGINAGFIDQVFDETKCTYERAILHLLYENDSDLAQHYLSKCIQNFSTEWKKISSFAFNSKHGLLEEVQKKFELEEFLGLYTKEDAKTYECEELFAKWTERKPNSVYDSSLTYLQILESRMNFSSLLSNKFRIEEKLLTRSKIDWLIQMSNGMIEKGIFGGAEALIRKALFCKRQEKEQFIWDFYDSVANLKLKQLLVLKSRTFNEYEIVANLVKKEMDQSKTPISELEKLKFVSLKNNLFEGYLTSCLGYLSTENENEFSTADFVNKVEIIYKNYDELKRSIKQNNLGVSMTKEFEEYRKKMYLKFTLFIEKILFFVSEKTSLPMIKDALVSKQFSPNRLAFLFVDTLFTSIEITNLNSGVEKIEHNVIFSLIMKLIKVIQFYPKDVGDYFSQMLVSKKVPIWIFLYFIPQMIKFINDPNLVDYFEDLFRGIAHMYPESLIYHFNCSYEYEKDRKTDFCRELSQILKSKMDVNYKFIEGLILLQYPEIRLRESLTKYLSVSFERENAINELKELIEDRELLGKYNKKFIEDFREKIKKVISKMEANDKTVKDDISVFLKHTDPSRKENQKTIGARMKEFVKISDASLFFEEYNSNDWNRIEIPGTSYRKFEEPKPWKKLYIESFEYSLETLQSKQRPRKITLYGSDEKKYMLLVKAGEDVRLDQRIEELFEIMNRALKGHSECSKKQLQIKRFEVTPIRKMMGVFEWVDESQTLKQFLETEFKIVKETDKANFRDGNKAYELRMKFLNEISPPGDGNKEVNHQHKAILNAKEDPVMKCFVKCEEQIPYGLLRRALERLSKNFDSFLHIKNNFIANYALVCCVTYILGIGDRHLENFLIHMSTASVVLIDFGYSFGACFDLGVPELMPFRLTKCFEELMEPVGFEGIFKKSMISSFEAFSENVALISDYCEVFVDDPLLEWVWNNKKVVSQPEPASSEDPPEKALFAEKIGTVRRKLEGENPRVILDQMLKSSRHKHGVYAKTLEDAIWRRAKQREKKLSIPELVNELISLATDKNILGRTYLGWNPYV